MSRKSNKGLYQFSKPNPKLLETFKNPHYVPYQAVSRDSMLITIDCPEFTSLCPVTGQPDFGKLTIVYCPRKLCVESKSLKLYLMGFRNHGEFHEQCVHTVGSTLMSLMNPVSLRVVGDFLPRGGISIRPEYRYSC